MSERVLELGQGLEIWKVDLNELREQDLNARVMDKKMFERLSANIAKDGRLESLPFCAKTDNGIEIVSGYHRVRAARTAGLLEIFTIVDVTGLSRDKIASKQLSHNSIQGEDNEQIVKEIYRQIEDAEAKLSAFIDEDLDIELDKVKTSDIIFDLELKTVMINFLLYEKEVFDRAANLINGKYDEVYVAEKGAIKPFESALKRIGKEYDIRAMGTSLEKMAEITLEHLGEEVEEDEKVALRDIFGTAYIPREMAEIVKEAIEKCKKENDVENKDRWQTAVIMAQRYIGGDM